MPPESPYPAGDRLEVVGVGGVNAQGGISVTTLFVVEQLKDILEVLALAADRINASLLVLQPVILGLLMLAIDRPRPRSATSSSG